MGNIALAFLGQSRLNMRLMVAQNPDQEKRVLVGDGNGGSSYFYDPLKISYLF